MNQVKTALDSSYPSRAAGNPNLARIVAAATTSTTVVAGGVITAASAATTLSTSLSAIICHDVIGTARLTHSSVVGSKHTVPTMIVIYIVIGGIVCTASATACPIATAIVICVMTHRIIRAATTAHITRCIVATTALTHMVGGIIGTTTRHRAAGGECGGANCRCTHAQFQ
jgi:hypothetical protein